MGKTEDLEVVATAEPAVDGKSPLEKETTASSIREGEVYVPDDSLDELVHPDLKDYPVPLVARTVALNNDPTEPILTFRFWVLSTFWVIAGCVVSTFYYFKPYNTSLSSTTVQLLSWGMGLAMAKYLPRRTLSTFGYTWSLNPGPWNAKEHGLIIIAVYGSQKTAYGLGPLSAMELYYGHRVGAGWAILFLITTQMMGYGFVGVFRDLLVRPPKIFYPIILPNVAILQAMHRNPAATKKSLRFFGIVAVCAFVWQWFPGLIWPMLSSLPLLCYMGHGNWIAYILGSGYDGFGLLDLTLDWNYASFLGPLYTPLWSSMHQVAGAIFTCWFLYPILYFTNTLRSKDFPAMSSSTFDTTGSSYNISRIMTAQNTLNQAAMDAYSPPYWSTSYAMYFFWGFASSAGAIAFAVLWYGRDAYNVIVDVWHNRKTHADDPYMKLMDGLPRVPHWWYLCILVVCGGLSIGTLYGGGFQLPWWGFLIITAVSFAFTFPSGILFGIANVQVGMAFFSELIAGALFRGKPAAVLSSLVFGRQILDQTLNLISDYKLGYYLKIPERELFVGQVYGTLLGPFINYGVMRLIIDNIGAETLTGEKPSTAWLALKSRNFYSISVIWGILGPQTFFKKGSLYAWTYWGFLVGPLAVILVYLIHRRKPHWQLETRMNPVVLFFGATWYPVYQTVNILTCALLALFFMGYIYYRHPVWFRKYTLILSVGLDSGTQIMQTIMVFAIQLSNAAFPNWWGNNANAVDRCFPPSSLPTAMQ